ncbi:hypothetical protein WMY93_026049 [Mugilogobius chulae]|uniref:Pyrin domain-containing protein n=1 Tax=Mugilogobius chulae TaxID=88201 RepID=A0AAW0N7B0_9GOBI
MATLRMSLSGALEDLKPEDLSKFRVMLREKKIDGGPRLRRAQVDGKSPVELSDLLVEKFTGARAVEVTLELLRAWAVTKPRMIWLKTSKTFCPLLQKEQVLSLFCLWSVGCFCKQGTLCGPTPLGAINRVAHINPVLDQLLDDKVLKQEQYDRSVRSQPRRIR